MTSASRIASPLARSCTRTDTSARPAANGSGAVKIATRNSPASSEARSRPPSPNAASGAGEKRGREDEGATQCSIPRMAIG